VTEDRRLELEQYFDGELPAEDRTRIARGLESDAEGRRCLEELRLLRLLAQADDPSAERPVWRPRNAPWERRTVPWRTTGRALLAASLLIGVGLGLGLLLERTRRPANQENELAHVLSSERGSREGRRPHTGHNLHVAYTPARHGEPVEAEILALELAHLPAAQDAADGDPAHARDAMLREDWHKAIAAWRKFRTAHPDSPRNTEARFWIGYCLVKNDDFKEAIGELEPFRDRLAKERWADAALLHLGRAYERTDQAAPAVAAWERLLEHYPGSRWRADALSRIIDLRFYNEENYARCLTACERFLKEFTDPDAAWQARHLGAYCLTALKRFPEADGWMERWLQSEEPVDEAWRVLLQAYRELLTGKAEAAFRTLDRLPRDFPELDAADKSEFLLRSSTILRQNGNAAVARARLLAALPEAAAYPPEELAGLFDALAATFGDTQKAAFRQELSRLASDPKLSLTIRRTAWERQVAELRSAEEPAKAAEVLRAVLAREPSEYARSSATLLLAEVLTDDLDDESGARELLTALLPKLQRRDYQQQVRQRLKEMDEDAKP
jgi:tetratricopeptide (TPR) repeat protein